MLLSFTFFTLTEAPEKTMSFWNFQIAQTICLIINKSPFSRDLPLNDLKRKQNITKFYRKIKTLFERSKKFVPNTHNYIINHKQMGNQLNIPSTQRAHNTFQIH